jgi:hypothetical protein
VVSTCVVNLHRADTIAGLDSQVEGFRSRAIYFVLSYSEPLDDSFKLKNRLPEEKSHFAETQYRTKNTLRLVFEQKYTKARVRKLMKINHSGVKK